jgi:RNA polymerase sigma factor (sigma-70 family)
VLIGNADELASRREDPLVTAVQVGAPEAFAQLYAIYSPRLYRTITAITKNPEDAQDALQGTFLRAHLRVHAFEGRSSIYSWLSRIAINCPEQLIERVHRRLHHRLHLLLAQYETERVVCLEHISGRCIVQVAILRAHAMARPYSDDLRRKLLEAFDQGKGSLSSWPRISA